MTYLSTFVAAMFNLSVYFIPNDIAPSLAFGKKRAEVQGGEREERRIQ
ncbi:hypothetical protein EST38_g9516 [Candolleomyces aberdarensis]|uniref:Uncharacterized protein n=1 Tax=Candolleomyces aberdarensis TaxID=2316362 RepID=A0A4Q2DAE7_9AGAR|nr:hypothetical protein EST38_g9516 [Candolleomyces aberdarensis]